MQTCCAETAQICNAMQERNWHGPDGVASDAGGRRTCRGASTWCTPQSSAALRCTPAAATLPSSRARQRGAARAKAAALPPSARRRPDRRPTVACAVHVADEVSSFVAHVEAQANAAARAARHRREAGAAAATGRGSDAAQHVPVRDREHAMPARRPAYSGLDLPDREATAAALRAALHVNGSATGPRVPPMRRSAPAQLVQGRAGGDEERQGAGGQRR
jgi:hypothetical protein